ncbi:MAG: hypothetical protein ACTSP4_07430, partial [Candidatus Hodarchaeales archaeon]
MKALANWQNEIGKSRVLLLILVAISTVATGIVYYLFQTITSTSRWLMVPIGIVMFSAAVFCLFQAFEWLRKYTSAVLALIAGTIIFFLFLGSDLIPNPLGDFNTLLLDSTLATFQTDITSIISVSFLYYFYLICLIFCLTILILLFNSYMVKKSEQEKYTILEIFQVVTTLAILGTFLLLIITTGRLGLDYRLNPSNSFQSRTNFYLLLGIISIIYVTGIAVIITSDYLKKLTISENTRKIVFIASALALIIVCGLFVLGVIFGLAPGFEAGGSSRVLFPQGSVTSEVSINEECSGIHSFTIFISCFYIALLYSGRFYESSRLIPALFIGTVGTLSSNWLRIIIILIIGYINTDLMWEVHNYAGLVIFFTWMLFFWFYAVDYLKKTKNTKIA